MPDGRGSRDPGKASPKKRRLISSMFHRLRLALALVVATVAFVAPAARAQNTPLVFTYRDADGTGRLTMLDVGPDAATGGRQIKVSIEQNGNRFDGSGISYQLEQNMPFTTLVAFTVTGGGASYFFSGKTISGITLSGQGTYHRVGFPENSNQWSIVLGGGGGGASGIRGVAMAGPIFPVERPGIPNTRPLANAIITVQPDGGGAEIARQRTDANGRFEIPLAPGVYRIVPLPPDPTAILPRGEPQTVTVRDGSFTDVVVNYDTGIR
jgi:hypothetical protein